MNQIRANGCNMFLAIPTRRRHDQTFGWVMELPRDDWFDIGGVGCKVAHQLCMNRKVDQE